MKNGILFLPALLLIFPVYAQEAGDADYDFGIAEGLTIYGHRPKDEYVLERINGTTSERREFIETEFLEKSGFKKNGNAKFRKTTSLEKAESVFADLANSITLGFARAPKKPFSEIEYDRLPKGEVYKFEAVFVKSGYNDVSPEVLAVIELEYMLQIEFCGGIILQDNLRYYTDENINKFEKLINGLPDFPESISQAKERYLMELQKIKNAFERCKNPSENYLMAVKNLEDSFNRK